MLCVLIYTLVARHIIGSERQIFVRKFTRQFYFIIFFFSDFWPEICLEVVVHVVCVNLIY